MADCFAAFLDACDPALRPVATAAGSAARHAFPDAVVSCDKANAAFGFSPRVADTVFVVSPQRAYVNLGFAFGAGLPDPAGLLDGTGKRHRHVKLRDESDVASPVLVALIEAALSAARARRAETAGH